MAESVLKGIDTELLERVRDHAAESKAPEPLPPPKRQELQKQRQQKRIKQRDQGMEL